MDEFLANGKHFFVYLGESLHSLAWICHGSLKSSFHLLCFCFALLPLLSIGLASVCFVWSSGVWIAYLFTVFDCHNQNSLQCNFYLPYEADDDDERTVTVGVGIIVHSRRRENGTYIIKLRPSKSEISP